jgi:TP901 family phage tail tape measure protein
MATAELGVRIVLNDGARTGLDTLGLSFLNLHNIIGNLALIAMSQQLSPQMKGLGMAAEVTGLAFHDLAGFVMDTVHAAADLESEVTKVALSVDGADENLDAMKQTLITVADSSIYTTAQVADGFAQMGIDGFNAQQIMSGMGQQGVILAEALNSQTVPAFNVLATAMELYRADASEAGQFTNDLTFLFYHGEKTIANMQAALQQVGPTAAMLKIPFGQLADVLALLGEDGLKGGQGAAALNYYLTALSSPIPKAQKALAALGLLIVHDTNPAVLDLTKKLAAAGVSADQLKLDGTVSQLQRLFTEAQKLNLVHTDETFMQWAIRLGIVKNEMYDANGQFIGLRESLIKLGEAMNGMTQQQKIDFISQLFNVRSGRAARDLLDDIEKQLTRLSGLDALRTTTDAAEKAHKNLSTLNNTLGRLSTTFNDFKAMLGSMDLGPITTLGNKLADALHLFNVAPDSVHRTAGAVLLAVTAFTGLAFFVTAVAFGIGIFGGAIAIALPIVLALGGAFALIGAAAGVIAWAIGQAQDKSSQFYGVIRPIFDLVGKAFDVIKTQAGQLFSALGNLGLNLDHLKVIGIVLLAVFVAPVILGLGILIGTVVVVVTIVTKLAQVFVFTRDMLGHLKDGLVAFVGLMLGTVVGGFTKVKDFIFGVFSFIGNLFPWLYHHNYYIQILVDLIHAKILLAQHIIQTVVGAIQFVWTTFWTTVGNIVHVAWNVVMGHFHHAQGQVSGAMDAIKHVIIDPIKNLATVLLDAGKNLINMLIQGIKDKLGELKNTLGTVAGTITGFLGFHSPPKEGPLSDSHTYMPNMMKMFAGGIDTHIPLVAGAVNRVALATTRVGTISSQAAASFASAASSAASGASGGGDIHIYIDGQEVTGRVLKRVNKSLHAQGIGRTMR